MVHCQAGINRSGCLAVAYVMVHLRLPLLEALRHCLRRAYPLVLNANFQSQLVKLARREGLLIKEQDPHSG